MSAFLRQWARSRGVNHPLGIYSVCSAHPYVLEGAMRRHASAAGPLLIEATCNQVNQFGGYSGMVPGDLRALVHNIADRTGFPVSRLLLGGDHLGPYPWQHLPAAKAMANACEMVSLFVREGYCKIHLDASMPCADDRDPLPENIIAERAAQLCSAAERSHRGDDLVYVIGTDVPTPGGAVDETESSVTVPDSAEQALRLHRQAFAAAELNYAWERVIALVVRPGVEFGNESIRNYEPARAVQLSSLLTHHPELIFEAHSTDYQQPQALSALVRDGFAILKVGPALTYAMRQVLFSLAAIETECTLSSRMSNLREQVDDVMIEHPEHWKNHYRGTPEEQHRLRVHSYSDRIRYYWNYPEVKRAIEMLIANLEHTGLPETLLSNYLPVQYDKFRAGTLENQPLPLILDAIGNTLDPYIAACQG
jgi:D-tagatose-1,6-bisphosphate aldolase subunit GatZ/KbaZ